jgi:hypothetical protein
MVNGNRDRLVNEHQQFLEEMLLDAQQSLAFARSVKEAKFIQNKLVYLKQRLKDMNPVGNDHGRKSQKRHTKKRI